jgi:hypothetical protein
VTRGTVDGNGWRRKIVIALRASDQISMSDKKVRWMTEVSVSAFRVNGIGDGCVM